MKNSCHYNSETGTNRSDAHAGKFKNNFFSLLYYLSEVERKHHHVLKCTL